MPDMVNPHDKFFKESFTRLEVARELFANYLPTAVRQTLSLDSLTLMPQSFVDQELQAQYGDLLYQVELADNPAETVYIYLLLEHKSYPDPLTPLQLLRYMVRIWDRDAEAKKPLCPIVPIVVYHGQATWHISPNFGALFTGGDPLRAYWPHFAYELQDISHLSDEEIIGSYELQLTLLLFKYIASPNLRDHLPEIFALLRELGEDKPLVEYMKRVLYYIIKAGRYLNRPELVKIVQGELAEEGNKAMQTIADLWIEEGREEGRAEGREEGREEGLLVGRMEALQETVLDLLYIRFGTVPDEIEERVNEIKHVATLQQWRRLAATAVSLTEFDQATQQAI